MTTTPAQARDYTLRIWRQANRQAPGRLATYQVRGIVPAMSFLEMLDVLNENLLHAGQDPVAFNHDCHEGSCGSCALFINGRAHGPLFNTASCQVYMRDFTGGDTITVEPWRATPFSFNKDLSRGSCADEYPTGNRLENIVTLDREHLMAKATSNKPA